MHLETRQQTAAFAHMLNCLREQACKASACPPVAVHTLRQEDPSWCLKAALLRANGNVPAAIAALDPVARNVVLLFAGKQWLVCICSQMSSQVTKSGHISARQAQLRAACWQQQVTCGCTRHARLTAAGLSFHIAAPHASYLRSGSVVQCFWPTTAVPQSKVVGAAAEVL